MKNLLVLVLGLFLLSNAFSAEKDVSRGWTSETQGHWDTYWIGPAGAFDLDFRAGEGYGTGIFIYRNKPYTKSLEPISDFVFNGARGLLIKVKGEPLYFFLSGEKGYGCGNTKYLMAAGKDYYHLIKYQCARG